MSLRIRRQVIRRESTRNATTKPVTNESLKRLRGPKAAENGITRGP